jgi:hypothetical protein
VYAFKFRQLAREISWDEATFMSQFQFGLCGNVKDLMLTTPNPTTLNQAIMQVMRYDNQLSTREALGTITNIETIYATHVVTQTYGVCT